MLRTLPVSLSLTCTVVGGRRFRPKCCCRDWASFSAISGHLECISMCVVLVQQQAEPMVEEWNLLTTIRIFGRRAESVVGCKQVFSVLMDSTVLACTFPRPFCCCEIQPVVLGDENCQSVFLFDVTTGMLCFCSARQLGTGLESLEISLQTGKFTVTHLWFSVVTAFRVAACVLLHACSFVSHPSLRTTHTMSRWEQLVVEPKGKHLMICG